MVFIIIYIVKQKQQKRQSLGRNWKKNTQKSRKKRFRRISFPLQRDPLRQKSTNTAQWNCRLTLHPCMYQCSAMVTAPRMSQLFCLSFHYGGTVNPWMLSDAFFQFEQEEKEREALEEGGNTGSNENNNNNTTQTKTRKLFESKNANSEEIDLRLLKET